MPKPTSAASKGASSTPIRVAIVTMDTHLGTATLRARSRLMRVLPGLQLSMHAASEWSADEQLLAKCIADIEQADIVVATMLFMEDHFVPILAALEKRRASCDAMVCAMSAVEVVRLTRLGKFDMGKPASGLSALLKRLRGNRDKTATGGAAQMKMLRRVPKLLRFIPGTAQDVRAYFLTLQYWLGGSEDNMYNMVRFLVNRYASGPRAVLAGLAEPESPIEYPELGVYHPRLKTRMSDRAEDLPTVVPAASAKGRVGVLLLRSYLLSGNSGHYDGVITALEAQGLSVIPAFASGLDARPAVERFFMHEGRPVVDAVVSLSGFSLVGGPAYNDSKAAEEMLARLDVPYVSAHPVEFQTIHQWGESERGLLPVESTIMVAIPELDGATAPMVFGGRVGKPGTTCHGCHKQCRFDDAQNTQDMQACSERAHMLACRIEKMIALRKTANAEKKIAVVLFNFPPNAGNTGTAAHLSVFESLFNVMHRLKAEGYGVDLPASVDDLRSAIVIGNKDVYGSDANVHTVIAVDDHVRRERWLAEIESQWGPAPGKLLTNGSGIFVLGRQFGNLLVAIQPSMGHEGDPMRLLFEHGFSPTHAFSAFYRYLREDFRSAAVLHFGTHGALEFMPGKQAGMSGDCWPDRLIGDLPNLYLYASNNPSEGTLAKRRAGATLISYLTPPVAQAGLYRGLADLKAMIDRWRGLEPDSPDRGELCAMISAQAISLDLASADEVFDAADGGSADERIHRLYSQMLELEYTLIPHGLHVVGTALDEEARVDMLLAMAEASHNIRLDRKAVAALVKGETAEEAMARNFEQPEGLHEIFRELAHGNDLLTQETELDGIVNALDGRFVRPAPGGDVLRTPDVLPTGRNLHGFDPFKIPSAYAVRDGARQAERLIERYRADGHALPESVAMVLWGTDNLKTEGSPIAQALALMGALPRFDSYGRVAGATLMSLKELGRPRIDVVITLSGIFRDLMPLQIRLLAEAAYLCASADEPVEHNFIRKHALAFQAEHQCTLEEAALRVYGNAEGTYGSNVNSLVENGKWDDEEELAETYSRRKGFAYGVSGRPVQKTALLASVLKSVELTYQNLESVELGVTTVDNYFDTLGGITGAVKRAKGGIAPPVYIGDQTRGDGTVRSLTEQVALETRTRTLNPKWYEGMLEHGYEGVRQIEAQITNTLGWSATTGQVQPWVYQQLTQTFLLDPQMRDRLARLNPTASAKLAHRLIEASERKFWKPDRQTLDALRQAGEELEDRLEGIYEGATT